MFDLLETVPATPGSRSDAPERAPAVSEETAAFEMSTMSTLRPRTTGIDGVIIGLSWGESLSVDLKHGPRIRVSLGDKLTREAMSKAVSVTVTVPPQVMGSLPGNVERQVFRFIDLNRQALIDHWNGDTDSQEFAAALQRI